MSSPARNSRQPLGERSQSEANSLAIRVVPYTPPRAWQVKGSQPATVDHEQIYSSRLLVASKAGVHTSPAVSRDSAKIEQGSALTAAEILVSSQPIGAKSQTLTASARQSAHTAAEGQVSATSSSKPRLKKRKHVAVNPKTKTFKVLDTAQQESPATLSVIPRLTPTKSWASLNGRSTPEGTFPERGAAKAVDEASNGQAESPWNYTFTGGLSLRKVPKTPESAKVDRSDPPSRPTGFTDARPPSTECPSTHRYSFQSTHTNESSTYDSSNYHLYENSSPSSRCPVYATEVWGGVGEASYTSLSKQSPEDSGLHGGNHLVPDDPQSLEATETNTAETKRCSHQIHHAEGSPRSSLIDPESTIIHHSARAISPVHSIDFADNSNYEVYVSSTRSSSFGSTSNLPRSGPTYSRESLIVAPLAPRARVSIEQGRHRDENLSNNRQRYQRTASSHSLRNGSINSISTVFSHKEATRAAVRSAALIDLPPLPKAVIWSRNRKLVNNRALMQETPHQWSSQLSTVPSESEGGSYRGSQNWSETRTSSGPLSSGSSHIQGSIGPSASRYESGLRTYVSQESLTSSQAGIDDHLQNSSDSSVRLVNDDEIDDVITDMPDVLRPRMSRTRLSIFGSSASLDGRTSTMRSTASSRLNSLTANSLPTWAKVYYGSGERKYLGARGSVADDSRPSSSIQEYARSRSPDDHLYQAVHSPRRRPRDVQDGHSLDIQSAPVSGDLAAGVQQHWTRRLKQQTSSIWSPHLQSDRRGARRSIWEPPGTSWSAESSAIGLRNRQVVLFVAGFILPLG